MKSINNTSFKVYLESLFKALGDVVFFLSPEGIITKFSPLAETYYSWQLKEIEGKSFESLYQIPTVAMPFSLTEYKRLIQTGQIIHSIIKIDDKKIYLSWFAETISPEFGTIIIGRNITEVRKLDIDYRTLNSQLEKIAAGIPGNFYWKNKNAQYLGCNDTLLKSLGLRSMKDIIGKTDQDLWPGQAEALRENDQKVIQTGEPLFSEEKVNMPGKGDCYFTVIKMPLLDEEGTIVGILGNSLDITELKNTQADLHIAIQKAEAANRAKTEFIANMGHDIRTPLTGIIGFSHHLEDQISNLEDKECAKQIHKSGEQLLKLLNGVLEMITADSTNEDSISGESFDLHELVHDVLELEIPAVQARHLSIESHLDEMVPHHVIGDKMKLHRILLNLAGNAIKFTKAGHIEINAKVLSRDEDVATIEFQVKDTGIGIPEELQDKVFDRFYKISPSYKGLYTGNGIGLHIAQKYASLLGGTLRLESKEGVGTSFFFTLKMKLDSQKSIEHDTISASAFPNATLKIELLNPEQCRVLLVEDNPAALKVLQMMFTPFETELFTAKDAESAFLLVQQQAFDLIISDIGLLNKSGYELTRDIRAFEKEQQRKPGVIVGLTGHALNEITQVCLDLGMNEVYQKPMKKKSLNALMNRFNTKKTLQNSSKNQNAKEPLSQEQTIKYEEKLPMSHYALKPEFTERAEDLIQLDKFPLLDSADALQYVGTIEVLKDMLQLMKDSLPEDLNAMKTAYADQDSDKTQRLAHKIKSGALYVGTVRMKMACQSLEHYWKSGQRDLFDVLYLQAVDTIKKTLSHIEVYLRS